RPGPLVLDDVLRALPRTHLDGSEFIGETTCGGCGRGLAVARQREGVLLFTADEVLLRQVLRRLAHGLDAVLLAHARVDEAPAEGRVVHGEAAGGEALLGFRHGPRRAAHRLHAAGDVDVRLAELHGASGLRYRFQARAAQPVHRHAGHADREPRQQRAHAGHVAVVLAGLVGAAEDHVGDVELGYLYALDEGVEGAGRQVVWSHAGEGAAVPADGRAHGVDQVGLAHRAGSGPPGAALGGCRCVDDIVHALTSNLESPRGSLSALMAASLASRGCGANRVSSVSS